MPISEEALRFLTENLLHDSKAWYQEHREDYKRLVMEPMTELAEKLIPTVISIDPEILTNPRKCISRIYRDTRFTKDKTLFRDVVWCSFFRDKNRYEALPGLFFEFSPAGFRYGCGFYMATTRQMQTVREMILAGSPSFQKALEAYTGQNEFVLEGDCYKRPHYPDKSPELREWLERKNIVCIKNSRDFDLLFSDSLAGTVQEGFLKVAPVYRFLCEAAIQGGAVDAL